MTDDEKIEPPEQPEGAAGEPDKAEPVADAPAETPADEPAAAAPEEAPAEEPAAEEPVEPAAEEPPAAAPEEAAAPPAPPSEPQEQLTPKERRRRARAAKAPEARGPRSPEDRAAERAERRAKSAASRRSYRVKQRQKRAGRERTEPLGAVSESTGRQRVRQGVVVSAKPDKTITVRIDVTRRHREYKKIIRERSTLHAHDERNEAGEGDTVRVVESRPLSRLKRWRLVEVVEKAR